MARSLARLALTALVVGACAKPLVPGRLADMPRTKLLGGQRAVEVLSRMHGGKFRPERAVIAEYGKGRLSLYVAFFGSESQAQEAVQKMIRGIEQNPQFTRPSFPDPQVRRWLTVGPGNHHLFWRSGKVVLWLAGEPQAVFSATGQLPPPPRGVLI